MSEKKMTRELFEKICRIIEETHVGLKTICKENNTSSSSFYDFIDANQDFAPDIYTRAKTRQADFLADLSIEIAFDNSSDEVGGPGFNIGANHINRAKLKVDTIHKSISQLNPKKYGSKIELDNKLSGSISVISLGSGINPEENETTS